MILYDAACGSSNRLLAHLREADQERLQPHLQTLTLDYERSLYRAHEPIEFVYFVESGVASLVNTLQNGAAAEVGTIGNEGMVGLPVLLGETEAPTSVYIQVPGSGLRMSATIFEAELDRLPLGIDVADPGPLGEASEGYGLLLAGVLARPVRAS